MMCLEPEFFTKRIPIENDSTSQLIYYLSKYFPNEFLVSIFGFNTSSTQHDVNFVNYGDI